MRIIAGAQILQSQARYPSSPDQDHDLHLYLFFYLHGLWEMWRYECPQNMLSAWENVLPDYIYNGCGASELFIKTYLPNWCTQVVIIIIMSAPIQFLGNFPLSVGNYIYLCAFHTSHVRTYVHLCWFTAKGDLSRDSSVQEHPFFLSLLSNSSTGGYVKNRVLQHIFYIYVAQDSHGSSSLFYLNV